MSYQHIRGDGKCSECCCGGGGTHKDCGGFWHDKLVADGIEEGYIHNYRCDKCNLEDYRFGYEDCAIEFKD